MAQPLKTAKQTVNLASNLASAGPRVSRIRRDPPPAVKETLVPDRDERDQWVVAVGVLAFALAIFTVILAFGSYSAWSPRGYTVEMTVAE